MRSGSMTSWPPSPCGWRTRMRARNGCPPVCSGPVPGLEIAIEASHTAGLRVGVGGGMRSIVLAAALIGSASLAWAQEAPRVDLNHAGVLEQLQLDHPARYQTIVAILHASARFPCRQR